MRKMSLARRNITQYLPSSILGLMSLNFILREELEIKPLVIFSIEVHKLSSKPFVITT